MTKKTNLPNPSNSNLDDYNLLFEFGVDRKRRIITISEDIEPPLFNIVSGAVSLMEADSLLEPITVRINSYGGSIYEALAVIGLLKYSPCAIITEGYGAIMSAAGMIFVSGTTKKISKHAWFMWHEMSFETGGKLSQITEEAKHSKKEMDTICDFMAAHTKKPASFWKKNGKIKDLYFNAEEALAVGIADELI